MLLWLFKLYQGMYLPLVMIAFDMLMSRFDILMVVGMAAAHVYWYFEAVYPQLPTSQGARPLKPPQFM
jgi:Derlin-2/3